MWKSCCEPTSKLQGEVHVFFLVLLFYLLWQTRITVPLIVTALIVKVVAFILNLNGGTDRWEEKTKQKKSRSGMSLSGIWHLGLCVCNVQSWFAWFFQVRDHGADGRVTGDIIWAALPLGSEWVQYTEIIPQSHYVHIVQGLHAELDRT